MRRLLTLFVVLTALSLQGCGRSSAPASVKKYSFDNAVGSIGIIQVYEGDNLYRIAKNYNIPIRDLIEVNKLNSPFILNIGDRLTVPSPRIHTVQKGESYASIARLYDLSITELVRQNNATSPFLLHEGDQVYLSRSRAPKATTSSNKLAYSKQRVEAVKKSANMPKPPKRSSSKGFQWPVQGRLLSSYGAKKGGLFNDGINIGAPKGSVVRSAENGVVVYSGSELKGFGNLVLVKHDGGYVTAYAHLGKSLVKKGMVISKGEGLGTVGSTGSVSTPQLHFEIRKNGKAINPKGYLG